MGSNQDNVDREPGPIHDLHIVKLPIIRFRDVNGERRGDHPRPPTGIAFLIASRICASCKSPRLIH